MLFQKRPIDERMRNTSRTVAAISLGATQVLLAGVIFFRLYVNGQPDGELRDFQAVLGISIFGTLALQLFLGGALPVPTLRGMLVGYAVLAGLVTAVCLAIYGIPPAAEWHSTWLPALAGPAAMVGAYAGLARLGQWNVNRQIKQD
jgi:hypothetical protein